jgi:hypothetical protein
MAFLHTFICHLQQQYTEQNVWKNSWSLEHFSYIILLETPILKCQADCPHILHEDNRGSENANSTKVTENHRHLNLNSSLLIACPLLFSLCNTVYITRVCHFYSLMNEREEWRTWARISQGSRAWKIKDEYTPRKLKFLPFNWAYYCRLNLCD